MVRLLVKLGVWILGKSFSNEEPRADMYLPLWLLAFSMVLMVGGVMLEIYAAIHAKMAIIAAPCGIGAIVLGIAALYCWKNQTITMLDEDTFEYSTFLGNKKIYRFDQIVGLRKNNDSMTLLMDSGKVHIEFCAILSRQLTNRIDHELEKIYAESK